MLLSVSSAHGLLENVQKILSTGRITGTISLNITAEELTVQVPRSVAYKCVVFLETRTPQSSPQKGWAHRERCMLRLSAVTCRA